MKIQFLGGAGTVTGSKFLIESTEARILVDCGLFQGLKDLRLQNWEKLPIDVGSLDAVILTHAHLDHSGYLPVLRRQGFHGPVFCTGPTAALTEVILNDSAKLHEEDARDANERGYSVHHPARPLYDTNEVRVTLGLLQLRSPRDWHALPKGGQFRFLNAGHILGSSIVELELEDQRIVFSGDLGRSDPILLHPADPLTRADYLVIESTYGDRLHSPLSPMKDLARIIHSTWERGGQVLIPAFAVGRTQDLIYMLEQLRLSSQIPLKMPIYLDSPMGIETTRIFCRFPEWHRLSDREVESLCATVISVRDPRQSAALRSSMEPAIIIAGSGMLTGGRIVAHLAERVGDARNSVVLAGYQALGTRGRQLEERSPELKMFGRYFPVRAEVHTLASLSAHADQRDLLRWAGTLAQPPKQVFIVHGEPQAADVLRLKMKDALGFPTRVPKASEICEVGPTKAGPTLF